MFEIIDTEQGSDDMDTVIKVIGIGGAAGTRGGGGPGVVLEWSSKD